MPPCRCFPHVVNICVQHVLAAFEDDMVIDNVPNGGGTSKSYEAWKGAVGKKPITRLRALIKALRGSGKRREAFADSIREGNAKSHFVDPEAQERGELHIIKVPEVTLLRDVDTRWDSVYHMISRARILRPVRFPITTDLFTAESHCIITGH